MPIKNKFYITTTLPYVNAKPHIGFALEIIQADVIARYRRLMGDEVIFNTGTDEHGVKVYRKAIEQGRDPKEYCDEYAKRFSGLKELLNLSFTNFIRTTDEHHVKAAQEFWNICFKNNDIYKKDYRIKYCVGCELEKTDSDLVHGKCPIHPNLELEEIDEENYFFKFSKYQKQLLKLYDTDSDFIVPFIRMNEIRNFTEGGLSDFSVSRLKSKMPWGVEIPGDPDHVMYVWFDALVNYISTLGWPEEKSKFQEFWPGVQIAGKDNLRQQSAIWQAMLMSAGLPPSKQILIHGFVTHEGEKMGKSQGNVVDPYSLVEKYGADAVRYYLLREIPSGEDGDFSYNRLEARYNGDLANGLGNLIQRVATLIDNSLNGELIYKKLKAQSPNVKKIEEDHYENINSFKLHEALANIWNIVGIANAFVDGRKPWAEVKENPDKFLETMTVLVDLIHRVAWFLQPFLPDTSERIFKIFGDDGKKEVPDNYKFRITKGEVLFPRIQ